MILPLAILCLRLPLAANLLVLTVHAIVNLGSGLSACGPTYGPDDFIVALSQETFGWDYPSKYCNKEIIISYGGKTANAKIVDSVRPYFLFRPTWTESGISNWGSTVPGEGARCRLGACYRCGGACVLR